MEARKARKRYGWGSCLPVVLYGRYGEWGLVGFLFANQPIAPTRPGVRRTENTVMIMAKTA